MIPRDNAQYLRSRNPEKAVGKVARRPAFWRSSLAVTLISLIETTALFGTYSICNCLAPPPHPLHGRRRTGGMEADRTNPPACPGCADRHRLVAEQPAPVATSSITRKRVSCCVVLLRLIWCSVVLERMRLTLAEGI